jgi:hypothetical protein
MLIFKDFKILVHRWGIIQKGVLELEYKVLSILRVGGKKLCAGSLYMCKLRLGSCPAFWTGLLA